MRSRAFIATFLSVLALTSCGDDTDSPSAPAPTNRDAAVPAAECGEVMVPGHEATSIRAGGVGCDLAKRVAAAAEGRGREPFEAEGFECEPVDAGGGDTNYTCTRAEARISFRYGTSG